MPDPFSAFFRVAIVEAGRVVEEFERRARDAEIAEHTFDDRLHGRQAHQAVAQALGDEGKHARVDAHRELRRAGGAGKNVEHLAHAQMLGIGEMEGLPVELRLVGDVVEGADDEIDRHDVDEAALDATSGIQEGTSRRSFFNIRKKT